MTDSGRASWEDRLDEYWESVDLDDQQSAITRMKQLIAELGLDDAVARFELGGVYDSVGLEHDAAVEYEAALSAGLAGARLARLTIQYGSTLRNLGRIDDAISLLQAAEPHPSIGNARTVFLALALHDAGRSAEALRLTIDALTPGLPRYQRSVAQYAKELHDPPVAD